MDIRKAINNSPAIAIIVIVILVAACGWFLWSEMKPAGAKPAKAAFFTVDDGATWFVDDVDKFPPFDKDGKPAVRAYLYKCSGSNKPVVGYLEQYTAKGKTVIEKYTAERKANPQVMPASLGEFASMGIGAMEVKKPGEKAWINKREGTAQQIMQFKCPSGETE